MNLLIKKLIKPAAHITQILGGARALALICIMPCAAIASLTAIPLFGIRAASMDIITFAGLTCLATIYLGAGYYSQMQSRLERLNRHTNNITSGNFSLISPSSNNDILAGIENDIARLAKEFERLITRINQSATEAFSASKFESEVAQRTANSATAQAESLAQVATAIGQMSTSVAQVTEQVSEIKSISEQTLEFANQGEEVVTQTISNIRDISAAVQQTTTKVDALGQRSAQISEIIEVIQDIANQTNLLALNAAIEAARAGEHGRGFAVVSDEVRQLSIRTHEATQNVADMVGSIQSEVEGTIQSINAIESQVDKTLELSDSTTEKLQAIKNGANRTVEAMHLAASAITEQSQVCDDVRSNIDSINQMTETAAQDAIETKDTAVYLETLSQRVLNTLPTSDQRDG